MNHLRHDYAAEKAEIAAEHAARLARVPNAARLLAALDEAPWVDVSAGRGVFAARVAARERANAAANYCEDLSPEVVAASLRRCGLVEEQEVSA